MLVVPDGAATAAESLDRAALSSSVTVPALRVPRQKCAQLMKQFRGYTLDRPRMKCVLNDEGSEDTKLLLLEPETDLTSGLTEELRAIIQKEQFEVVPHTLIIDYAQLKSEQALRRLLPQGVDVPSSFETVGHVVHLNLRNEQLPFKHVIGQVILDKNPHVRTVVNKVGSIENEFRVFTMELLAGEADTETEVTQHGARFKLDFSQVYWNSRLESEHHRLVNLYFKPGEVVVDMMAGIGPFAIPGAQAGCEFYANDLNPASTKYLAANAALNRVLGGVHVFTLDARAFVRLLCATPGGPADGWPLYRQQMEAQADLLGSLDKRDADDKAQSSEGGGASTNRGGGGRGGGAGGGGGGRGDSVLKKTKELVQPPPIPPSFTPQPGGLIFQHAVMNLPASAIEFVDAFRGAFSPMTWNGKQLPLVHVYCFKTAVESEADMVTKLEGFLGGPLDSAPRVHHVRDVAPNKIMLCISFRVPAAVAFHGREREDREMEAEQEAEKGDLGAGEQPGSQAQKGVESPVGVSKKPRLEGCSLKE